MSKSKFKFLSYLLYILLVSKPALAVRGVSNELFSPRPVTPSRLSSAELSAPDKFETSNNLIRKTGSFYTAEGEVIYIQGKVTDSFGLPIDGAIIEIWQTNSAGKYQALLEEDSEFIDKSFSASGRAVTDNLGNYYFVTVMPGFYLNRTPHININIYHERFGKIETEMYFENHPRNNVDYQYLSYGESERKMVTSQVRLADIFDATSTKICTFNITMNGVHQYKSFGNSI